MEALNRVNRAGTALLLAMLLAALAACSSKSNSGTSQGATAPTAIATPIGYRGTGTNPMTLTVRSGADVQLTGIDSDDGDIGISGFEWTQMDTAPIPQVSLIYRNSSTVSFKAPSVASPTTLHFQLKVSNGVGASTAPVQVSVLPASDPNEFLSLLATPHRFRVALSLTNGSATSGTPLTLPANIPVCVRLSEHIEYTNYNRSLSAFPLPDQTVETQWLAAAGAMAGFVQNPAAYLAFRNPVVSFDLPALDEDLIFAAYNQPGANSTQVGEQLVASDIDMAYVPMQISATPGTCDASSQSALGGLHLMLQLQDEAGDAVGAAVTGPADGAVTVNSSALPEPDPLTPAGSGSTALTPDDFLRVAQATNPQIETRESAAAYYAAINPASEAQKTTLPTWLQNNCFDPASPTYGEGESGYNVVHATYTNNFDLGFGRDMYFATCSNGNLASVVINYPSIDTAANKVGAFLAVAMEYAPQAGSAGPCFSNVKDPTTNTGLCFAKFYAFAPDDRTGTFERVMSVDFDRRGQKYLPGACTVCHGGSPNYTPAATAPAKYRGTALRGAGDLEAVFMPWDVSSLLFSDTDPSFACTVSPDSPSCTSINPASYTQAAQAPHLQQLNALAWSTYDIYSANGKKDVIAGVPGVSGDARCAVPGAPGEPCVLRFQGGVDLLTKWYGGNPGAASAHAFDDSTTPSTWPAGQSAPSDLYHRVFAHYCRSCHVQSNIPSEQFASGFTPLTPIATFGTPPNVQHLVYDRNQMPLSRLTADRFWVDFEGGQSAAQTLASYINGLAQGSPKVAAVAENQGQVIPPGAPLLVVESSNVLGSNNSGTLSTTSVNALNRFQGASLNAFTQSLFVSSYQWTLCSSATSECTTNPLELAGTPPISGGSSAGAAQSGTSFPGLTTSAVGSFYLTLTANSATIGQAPLIQTFPLKVSATDPVLAAGCTTTPTANFNGQPVTVDVSSCFAQTSGQPQLGDPPYSLQISYDGVTYGTSAGGTGSAWQASVVPASGAINLKTGFPLAPPTIQFNFTPNATANVPLYFKWCDGNNDATSCASGSVQVTLLTGLTATPALFLGYWDPTANPNYGGVFTPPVTGSPMRPTLSLSALDGAIGVNAPSATLTLAPPSDGGSLSSTTFTGSASSLMTQLGLLTYGPCGSFVTQDVNGLDTTSSILLTQLEPPCALPLAGGVTFAYTLSDGSQSQSSSGTINIRALSSFQQTPSQVYGTLGTNCSNAGCHGGPAVVFWRYDATSANSTYTTISTGHDNFGALLVKPGQPSQSAFYTAPCLGTDAAGGPLFGMVQVFQQTASQCQILYQWILEGGQNN